MVYGSGIVQLWRGVTGRWTLSTGLKVKTELREREAHTSRCLRDMILFISDCPKCLVDAARACRYISYPCGVGIIVLGALFLPHNCCLNTFQAEKFWWVSPGY
jgi:hypothetical protein